MNENQKQISGSEEIDLGIFLSKIGGLISSLFKSFINLIALLRRIPIQNKYLFITLITSAIVIAVGYTGFRDKLYSTKLILRSDYLTVGLTENEVEKLNDLAEDGDFVGLAKILNISDDVAKNIYDFQAAPFITEEELQRNDILRNQLKNLNPDNEKGLDLKEIINQITIRNAYTISIRVFNPNVVDELEVAIVNYFRNNPYVKKRIEVTRANMIARKEKLIEESKKLDSLKLVILENYKSMAAQSRQGSNNVILSDRSVTDPIQVYNQDLTLYGEIQSIDRYLYIQNDFEIVSGFTEFTTPSSPGYLKASALAGLIAISIGYLIIALLNFNAYLAKLDQ